MTTVMHLSRTPALAAAAASLVLLSAAAATASPADAPGQGKDFLQVTVNRPGAQHVLSWERIPYAS